MDISMDGGIDREEWNKFYKLFMHPFLKCYPDVNFEISIPNAKKCFAKEDWVKHVASTFKQFIGLDATFNKMHPEKEEKKTTVKPLDTMFELMDRNSNGSVNLSEYIFARRVSFIFRKCTFGDRMNYTAVQCGMNLLSDGGRITSDEARVILRNSIQLFSDRGTTLGFLSF